MKTAKKVLIAEDELLIAKVLRMQLEKQGFVVENIADGKVVFEKVKQMQPDIIIMDMQLKAFSSGLEAARQIREAEIATPIIFTTGNSYDNTVELVKEIADSKVLTKPVEFERLLGLLNGI